MTVPGMAKLSMRAELEEPLAGEIAAASAGRPSRSPIAAVSGAANAATLIVAKNEFHAEPEKYSPQSACFDAERGEIVVQGRGVVAAHGPHEAADRDDRRRPTKVKRAHGRRSGVGTQVDTAVGRGSGRPESPLPVTVV